MVAFCDIIEKENTGYFGFDVDFGTFQDKFDSDFRLSGIP